jgi:small ligand-binding sensory domain FIST
MTPPLSPPRAVARTGLGLHADWSIALGDALAAVRDIEPELVLVFAGSTFTLDAPAIADRIWRDLGAPIVLGATGLGVMAQDHESEREPAICVMGLRLPGAVLTPVRLSAASIANASDPAAFQQRVGVLPEDGGAWVLLANPFRFDVTAGITGLTTAYPEAKVIGGIASPDPVSRRTALMLNGEALFDGAVALAIGGPYSLRTVLSQGAEPFGHPWTITGVDGEWIETIAGRPALQVLDETLRNVPEELRIRTQRNLLIGLAVDEYQESFKRGDFVVRNLAGIDQTTGAIAIGAEPRVGQTIQFQIRDAATADLDLGFALDALRQDLTGVEPVAALAFAGSDRGQHLFGQPHHDARAIHRKLAGIPTLGLVTAGEIAPTGGRTILQSMSTAIGLIVRATPAP